jgi:hypothetical protein
MIAIEIEASIVDHRIDIRSELLPASASRAKLIVMYEEGQHAPTRVDVLALARTARASFPRRSAQALAQDLSGLRDEWSREL